MLIHDSWSSVGVTLALLTTVVFSRRWRYDGRTGSLAAYSRARSGWSSTLAQLAELPWFVLNVARKVLIAMRVRQGPWPY
jgi:hypothetical protein